jgi:hypothetical protein
LVQSWCKGEGGVHERDRWCSGHTKEPLTHVHGVWQCSQRNSNR